MTPSLPEQLLMRRCLDLAKLGKGNVSPNPLVGAVLSLKNAVISEGYHQQFGSAHAEVNALDKVKSKSIAPSAILHVSLEPCCHEGKTGACTDRIFSENIHQVNVAIEDPFPPVAGKGIQLLKAAKIKVKQGILAKQAESLNRAFIYNIKYKKPFVILKWAESRDGFMGKKQEQIWLSNSFAKRLVHKWRSESDAILVGSETILIDDPQLTTRFWFGNSPTRVVIDKRGRIPITKKVFNSHAKTIYFSTALRKDIQCQQYIINPQRGELDEILHKLYLEGIGVLFVEGGRDMITSFIEEGLWNEAHVIKVEQLLHSGIEAPKLTGTLAASIQLSDNVIETYCIQ